jgi:DNA-binding NtrC family response regulator
MATIILADDEENIRKLMTKILSRAGHTVMEARNGHETLALYSEHSPDLVITDMIMPQLGGGETIRALTKEDPEVRIIAISGGGRAGQAVSSLRLARELGARHVVAKPFTLTEFMGVVNEVLKEGEQAAITEAQSAG